MTHDEKRELELTATRVREGILTSTHAAKSGHPGGSLSAADLFTYLYGPELRVDPSDPRAPGRDRFVLSKGHTVPGLYSVLALRGFFPSEDLTTLRHVGSHLQGHPNMNTTPGIDMSTGSLGQGVSAAAGMAKGVKLRGEDLRVYTLLGDGEMDEGEVWEAAMFASHYKLDNLCLIVDINGLQIDGRTEEVMDTASLAEKLAAFGFDVIEIDGHDFDQIEGAFARFHANIGGEKPTAVLARTIKGKGVSYMEDQVGWHGKAPNDEEYAQGMAELAAKRAELEG